MNTVRILICLTFALLVAALVHSYSTNGDSNSQPKDKSISELKEELERIKLENSIKRERAATNPIDYTQFNNQYTPPVTNDFVNPITAVPPVTVETTPSDSVIAKLDALEAENAKLKAEQERQESENNMLLEEAEVIQEELFAKKQPEIKRAAEIAQALVMARVKEYSAENGIAVLDLVRAQNLNTGQILGIRRGSAGGIIGRIKLGHLVDSAIGYGDPIAESFFGAPIDVRVGDELIVIP